MCLSPELRNVLMDRIVSVLCKCMLVVNEGERVSLFVCLFVLLFECCCTFSIGQDINRLFGKCFYLWVISRGTAVAGLGLTGLRLGRFFCFFYEQFDPEVIFCYNFIGINLY